MDAIHPIQALVPRSMVRCWRSVLYLLNCEHLAAPAVEILAGMRNRLIEQLHEPMSTYFSSDRAHIQAREPIIDSWKRDAITVHGPDLTRLFRRLA